MRKLVFLLTLFLMDISKAEYLEIPNLPTTVYESQGDINIGGLFPIHQAGSGGQYCGELRELGVLQRAEAMAFYIQQINRNKRLLPGIKLGYVILDDCYKETTALAQALQFVQKVDPRIHYTSHNVTTILNITSNITPKDVVAVIGAESSTNSKQIAELLGLFEIPQVSYLSTSNSLSDRVAYPFFSRIVPSDRFQVQAILALMEHLDWQYVSFIYTLNEYGLQAYRILQEKLKGTDNNVCIAVEHGLLEKPTTAEYDDVIDRLNSPGGSEGQKQAHAVILFMPQVYAKGLLERVQMRGYSGKFTWIGSDAWGRNVQDFQGIEQVSEGALTIKINSTNDPEFDKHFSQLNPKNTTNPFLSEFWKEMFGSKCNDTLCNVNGKVSDAVKDNKPESTVGLVKLAVYLIATALDEMMAQCRSDKDDVSDCVGSKAREYVKGKHLQRKIRGTKGCMNGTCIDVSGNGDATGSYSIMNYRTGRDGYMLEPIGEYDSVQNLSIVPLHNIHWNSNSVLKTTGGHAPISVCSEPCLAGQKQIRSMSFWHSKCCWECKECAKDEVTFVEMVEGFPTTQCRACPFSDQYPLRLFTAPANESSICIPIVPENLGFHNSLGTGIVVIDFVALIVTLVLLGLYIKNRNEKLIMATSRELSYVIWTGVIFSYLSIIFFFLPLHSGCNTQAECAPEPYTSWCYIQYITFNSSFTIINAPILTRANRIHRIFRNGKRSAKKPRFIETKYQMIFIFAIISIQAAIILISIAISVASAVDANKIKIQNHLDEKDINKSYVSCEIPYALLPAPIIYNLLIVLACAFHAFKTRKLPDNYNESKFIGITVYTAIIMWIAFIPSYLTITSQFHKALPLTIGMLINACITTSVLFVPRLYALHWVEKIQIHVRAHSHSVTSSTSGINSADNRLDRINSSYSSVTTVLPSSVTFDLNEEVEGDLSTPNVMIESPQHGTTFLRVDDRHRRHSHSVSMREDSGFDNEDFPTQSSQGSSESLS